MKSIPESFRLFHRDNPHVAPILEKIIQDTIYQVGHKAMKHLGMRWVWEQARWFEVISTRPDGSDYRLNDHYIKGYAKTMLYWHPEWTGLFKFRKEELRDDYTFIQSDPLFLRTPAPQTEPKPMQPQNGVALPTAPESKPKVFYIEEDDEFELPVKKKKAAR